MIFCLFSVKKWQFFSNLTNFGPRLLTLKPPYSIKEVHLEAHILPKASKNLYYQKMYPFPTFMKWKCTKSAQMSYICYFCQFLDPYTHSKAHYDMLKVHVRAHILPKAPINLYYQKMYSFPTFLKWKCPYSAQKLNLGGKNLKILT